MEPIIVVAHILLSFAIIGLILIQQGKGADAGASFGGGASQTVFGSKGSGSFLTRSTGLLVALFFVTSMTLAVFARQHADGMSERGIPSAEAIEQSVLDNDRTSVEEYAPSDAAEQAAEETDIPVFE